MSNKKRILMISVVVVLLGAIAAGTFLFLNKPKHSDKKTKKKSNKKSEETFFDENPEQIETVNDVLNDFGTSMESIGADDETLIDNTADPNDTGTLDDGEYYVVFGRYEQDGDDSNGEEAIKWEILDEKDGKVLIVSKYALDCMPFNDGDVGVSWENCTLRSWLNGDFYNAAFSSEEQQAIYETTLVNGIDPYTDVDYGNDTVDKVFLLSTLECYEYYGGDYENRIDDHVPLQSGSIQPTRYAALRGVRADKYSNLCYWWLRSAGSYYPYAAMVSDVQFLYFNGPKFEAKGIGVRPAMWVSADAVKTGKTEESPISVDAIIYKIDPILLGKWSYTERRQTCYVTFFDDNTCILVEEDGEGKYIERRIKYSADGGKIWFVNDDEISLMYYAQDGEKILIGDTPETVYHTLTREN